MQVMKQLSLNRRVESISRGWQLLCLCAASFRPSPGFHVRKSESLYLGCLRR